MITILFILFAISAFFGFFEERLGGFKWYIYSFLGVALILVAGLRTIGIDNDSINYEIYFLKFDNPLFENTVEYSYRYLSSKFYYWFGDVHSIFIFYAIFGVSLKMFAFRKLTEFPFVALSLYICTYFILHECTQIRVGISSGILLFIIVSICNNKKVEGFLLILIALIFHYSSSMLIPLLFLSNKDITQKQKKVLAISIILGYALYFLHIGLATLPIPYLAEKLQAYEELKDEGFIDEVNVFNVVYLVKIVIFYYILYFYDIIKEHSKYLSLMLKMEAISLTSFTALSTLPVLSFRVSELFGIVEIFLYVNIYYTIRPQWLSKILVLSIGFILMSITIFYNKLIQI